MPDSMLRKTVLVTGATSGIGLEAAVVLAGAGAEVVMIGRDPAKTAAALADVKLRSGSTAVESLLCDFSSQASIRKLAADFRAGHRRLDVLVNNAGTVNVRRTLTVDGIESTFAVNHLGYFLLTNLLLDMIVFLLHYFIRLGFLPAWRELLPQADTRAFFALLEANLNTLAQRDGALAFGVPMAYVECERA
jgi:NAD(P)-dependent dehydrogenase (short-subunit alcohol dehydrogenase family)